MRANRARLGRPTVLRDATHVAATTTHFSLFVPAIPPPSSTTADAGAQPEPDAGACSPKLCGAYGPGACGTLDDGCGDQLDCGSCTGADAGTGADSGTCMALTCENYGASACGDYQNGCGKQITCRTGCQTADGGVSPVDGGSSAPDAAGGDGGACAPMTCRPSACGSFYDPCSGATIDCKEGCALDGGL